MNTTQTPGPTDAAPKSPSADPGVTTAHDPERPGAGSPKPMPLPPRTEQSSLERLYAAQAACPHLTSNTTGTKCADCGARFQPPSWGGGSSFSLPQRTRQPRFEPGCNCPRCRPWWTG